MKNAEERSKRVHGLAFGAFLAAAELFGTSVPTHARGFKEYLVTHTIKAVQDVREEVNVNVFWQYLIDAYKVGEFGKGEQLRQYFRVIGEDVIHPPGHPNQYSSVAMPFCGMWTKYRLYFDYNAVLQKLGSYLVTKQRETLPLQRKDLRDQLSTYPYWIDGEHRQRLGNERSPSRVWAIDIDSHPLGYIPVSDEDLMASWNACGGNDSKWNDPRKGELFLIVHAAESAK